MTYHTQTKISDLVLEFPATIRIFEALHVDYCCGGHRTLAEACAHAHQDVAEVLARLAALPKADPSPMDPGRWQNAPVVDLIAHIEAKHHPFTRSELERLTPLMGKVLKAHGGRHPELTRIAECLEAMSTDLIPHLAKEEEILFPFIRRLELKGPSSGACFGSIQSPITVMQDEHEQVGAILKELRVITSDYSVPEDACGSYRALLMGLHDLEEDLHFHIYLENQLLFPRSIALEEAAAQI